MDGLTADQTEKILQFQDLTGLENMTVCRDVLMRHGWDLEVAVQEQLNMNEGRPSVFSSAEQPAPQVVNDSLVQRVFSSPPSSYNRWGGRVAYLVSYLFHLCYSSLISVIRLAYTLFWRHPTRVTDPVGDVLRFVQMFDREIGTEHPVFYQGSYNQVLNDAKRELKFLLVYLHCDHDRDCTTFGREVLGDRRVISLIDSRMLFWACNTSSGEGFRVVTLLRASGYPFLGLIVLRESRMTLVGRMEGPASAEEVVSRLHDIMDSNQQCLDLARADRVAREVTTVLRREQDQAYQESLRLDQEKERIKTQHRQQQLDKERDLQRKKQEIQDLKVELVREVVSEPDASHPDVVSIVFKLPTGERIERRFLASHTLKDVYNFIFCHPLSPDSFELKTNFPKRTLECNAEGGHLTLVEAQLQRKEVLFVHDLDA